MRKESQMFELLVLLVFVWLMFKVIGLALKLTWGMAKLVAGILAVIAVPVLFVCMVFAGGIVLLLPLAILGIAFGIVKTCV